MHTGLHRCRVRNRPRCANPTDWAILATTATTIHNNSSNNSRRIISRRRIWQHLAQFTVRFRLGAGPSAECIIRRNTIIRRWAAVHPSVPVRIRLDCHSSTDSRRTRPTQTFRRFLIFFFQNLFCWFCIRPFSGDPQSLFAYEICFYSLVAHWNSSDVFQKRIIKPLTRQ